MKAGDDMKTITRAKYLDRIIELNGTPDIKIITGIRRSGKSKLMQAYIEYLKSHFENINIIFIDFMDLAYEEIKEYHALHAYVEEHYQESKTNYLFVDEVQMCPKFELAINSLYSKGKYDIYVTGSNAFLLSADLATLFTGLGLQFHNAKEAHWRCAVDPRGFHQLIRQRHKELAEQESSGRRGHQRQR